MSNDLKVKQKPKVMIITMGMSRIVKPIVENYNVVGIIECAPRKQKNTRKTLVYGLIKKIYSNFKSTLETLGSYAKSLDIPYYYMDNGSDKKLESWVKNISPDAIVVFSMSQLLKENIFNIPKYGTINLHPALLPSYRGPNPDFWMYYNQENEGGVTVHYIDRGEDTGDIIYQEKYLIPLGMKSPDMLDLAIGELGVRLLFKAIDNVDNLPKIKQPEKSPTKRARNIRESEHQNLIDWKNWDIERVWHLLRGTELWLNAFEQPKGMYSGQRWSIDEFEKCDTSEYRVANVVKKDNRYFLVCRDGKIFLSVKFNLKRFIIGKLT